MGYTGKDGVMWNTSEKLVDTPYFFRRNRYLGTRFPYMWALVTSAVYHPHMYKYGKNIYIVRLLTPPTPRGVIISKPKTSFLGAVFDVDHDFEGPSAPKAHSDTVLNKPVA